MDMVVVVMVGTNFISVLPNNSIARSKSNSYISGGYSSYGGGGGGGIL